MSVPTVGGEVGSLSEACRGKASSPHAQPERQHKRPTQQPPEASSLYFSLLIGYRVQALTVVRPSEGRAGSARRWATWGPPRRGGLGGSQEPLKASPLTQP